MIMKRTAPKRLIYSCVTSTYIYEYTDVKGNSTVSLTVECRWVFTVHIPKPFEK